MSDIVVNMTDQTQVTSQEGFGKTLVISTTKDLQYKEYNISDNLSTVQQDFPTDSEMYKIINTFASQKERPSKIYVFGKDLTASQNKSSDLITALNTLITEHNNWYRLLLEDSTETIISAVSTWCDTNSKQFYTQFDETGFSTDFTAKKRTILGYKEQEERLDAAMAGYASTRVPGSFNYKHTPLQSITPDSLTPEELSTILSKNMNPYIKGYEVIDIGDSYLGAGVMSNGKYIDHMESMDWVEYRIKQEIAKLFITSQKIPYTNSGIQQVVTSVIVALQDAYNNEIIGENEDNTPAFTVDFKTLKDISLIDRSQRKLTGITFKYVEAGAIESTIINGSVVLEL
ncbi:DUF3383 family protein [Clostridium rectalis]|uniref:DUF3383 family protein n=1 Tax=Clostridium rectalis TaxID=2040295 RepID=UPI000F6324EB|nr:DUF3383 family protein [Clostridium rectalis]